MASRGRTACGRICAAPFSMTWRSCTGFAAPSLGMTARGTAKTAVASPVAHSLPIARNAPWAAGSRQADGRRSIPTRSISKSDGISAGMVMQRARKGCSCTNISRSGMPTADASSARVRWVNFVRASAAEDGMPRRITAAQSSVERGVARQDTLAPEQVIDLEGRRRWPSACMTHASAPKTPDGTQRRQTWRLRPPIGSASRRCRQTSSLDANSRSLITPPRAMRDRR